MIRKLLKSDRPRLKEIIDSIDIFQDEEKTVAVELIDEAIINVEQDYYNIFVYEENNLLLGYHCTGHRALTDGVFDLYWIVVDPKFHHRNIGKALLNHAENFAKENNGNLLLVETSSKKTYERTRNFYIKNRYSQLAEIKDFYRKDDNLIIFGKYL